jgi:hypothetical protein
MNLKTENSIRDFLKTLPDDIIIKHHLDIEWSPFPVLIIQEYQRRFQTKNKKEILKALHIQGKLANKKSNEMKNLLKKGRMKLTYLGKKKREEITKLSKLKGSALEGFIGTKGKVLSDKIDDTRTTMTFKVNASTLRKNRQKENLEILKKLGELKSAGVLNNKEFQIKKKKFLTRI